MNKLVTAVSVLLLTACGVSAEDNRDSLTKEQRAAIESRITPFSQLNTPESATKTAPTQLAAADAGSAKYAQCGACHGAQGQGGVGPMLAGKDAEYIVGRLRSYRNNEQIGSQSMLMWGQAAGLSDTDIQDLADYISSL